MRDSDAQSQAARILLLVSSVMINHRWHIYSTQLRDKDTAIKEGPVVWQRPGQSLQGNLLWLHLARVNGLERFGVWGAGGRRV